MSDGFSFLCLDNLFYYHRKVLSDVTCKRETMALNVLCIIMFEHLLVKMYKKKENTLAFPTVWYS